MPVERLIFYMNEKTLFDEMGSPYFFSEVKMRRYYPEMLGFKGTPREFARACVECPPDADESYTAVTKTWRPAFCKNYMCSGEFRDKVNRKLNWENFIDETKKDVA